MTLHVTVAPHSTSGYTALVYAGLFELRAQGAITLKFSDQLDAACHGQLPHFATLCLCATDLSTNHTRRVGFDFLDGSRIASEQLLANVDTYYKRSYRQSIVQQLPVADQPRVQPFGLHYACTTAQQKLSDRWSYLQAHRRLCNQHQAITSRHGSLLRTLKGTASFACAKYWTYRCPSNLPPLVQDVEDTPDTQAEPVIFYRTRVYEPTPGNKQRGVEVNANRVAVIRALKKAFGNRFVGGLRDSEFARHNYPDCIYPVDLDWRGHIALLRKSLIAVTTAGLNDSIDWKLAEYMAASRCIVTERLRYELPTPLQEDKEILSFDTPQECVDACVRLLTTPKLAQSLRHGAHSYYQQHLAPAQIVGNALGLRNTGVASPQR